MSAAFKNFFITFVLSLVLFICAAIWAFPMLENIVFAPEETSDVSVDNSGSASSDVSDEYSTVSSDQSFVSEGDKTFTGVIICKNSYDSVISCKFLRVNQKTGRVIHYEIPVTMQLYNNVGKKVPISTLFATLSLSEIPERVSVLTGFVPDFCAVINKTELGKLALALNAPQYELYEDINYINPYYKNMNISDDTSYPTDYYVYIPKGSVSLDTETVTRLFEYADTECYSGLKSNDEIYKGVINALHSSVFEARRSLSAEALKSVFNSTNSNISDGMINDYSELVFGYSQKGYAVTTISNVGSWENSVRLCKEADNA